MLYKDLPNNSFFKFKHQETNTAYYKDFEETYHVFNKYAVVVNRKIQELQQNCEVIPVKIAIKITEEK